MDVPFGDFFGDIAGDFGIGCMMVRASNTSAPFLGDFFRDFFFAGDFMLLPEIGLKTSSKEIVPGLDALELEVEELALALFVPLLSDIAG